MRKESEPEEHLRKKGTGGNRRENGTEGSGEKSRGEKRETRRISRGRKEGRKVEDGGRSCRMRS